MTSKVLSSSTHFNASLANYLQTRVPPKVWLLRPFLRGHPSEARPWCLPWWQWIFINTLGLPLKLIKKTTNYIRIQMKSTTLESGKHMGI